MSKRNYYLCTNCNQDKRTNFHRGLDHLSCGMCGQGLEWKKKKEIDKQKALKKVLEAKFPPNYSAPDQELRIGKLAKEIIQRALLDLQNKGYRKEVLEWFNKRDSHVFGYGWCLGHSRYNPNTIRRAINMIIGIKHV